MSPASTMWGRNVTADNQVFSELRILEIFAEYCDQIGIRIPNDSCYFRETALTTKNQDWYFMRPERWPNEELLEVMALAQHHGVPTRLLDWTKIPYAAVYFASSSAISQWKQWRESDRLAIWALNIERISLYKGVRVVEVPGSISPHLSAQSGLFTVHPHNGLRGENFTVKGLEDEFGNLPETPLLKITVPVKESVRLQELCGSIGFTGARIYPSADGAGKAVMDSLNLWALQKSL
ncbi:FRG domain-containing protein [Microbulbifer elongatus]|uniref:FRG domain-containing protein n=1 Tax=Microbulbifer elongatus TaxID=86173 RepID=UPI001CFEF37D|nr:FRG domain-containing protein [Microbulbifer elongatus]